MKIAVITDSHFGIKGDHPSFYDYFDKFYTNTFFPYLTKNNIKNVLHLGDLYDRRKYINFKTAKEVERVFLDPLKAMQKNYQMDNVTVLTGNHDIYYRNVNEINSLDILLKGYDFDVLSDPTVKEYDGCEIMLLPWICESNHTKTMEMIDIYSSKIPIAMGHLELNGFEMYRGITMDHGMDVKLLNKFKHVYSGHYHHKSTRGNITYLGACAEYTWHDFNDARGFHIFDTDTRTMEFIRNPYTIHKAIQYDDKESIDLDSIDVSDSFVKILVINKTDPYQFDKFIDKIYSCNPLDVTIIEDNLIADLESGVDDDGVTISPSLEGTKETVEILKDSIEGIKTSLDKSRLRKEIVDIYNTALALGTSE